MGLLETFTGSTGKKQAADTLAKNNATAQSGYDANKGYLSQGYGSATGRYQPYAAQGRTANATYGNMLGLGGADAQRGALQGFEQFNPYREAATQRLMQMGDRRAAATGQFGGGLNALARARVADDGMNRDYTDYMNRLQGLGGQGMQADSALAGLDMGYAGAQVGNQNMLSGNLMGNQSAYSNAYTQADTAGLQNWIGLGTAAAQAAMGMPPTALGKVGGGQQPTYSQPGNAMNGGWSTTATPAGGNNFFSWLGGK
jgi:hypothetical protein